MTEYYNKIYFDWQKHMGEFGGKAGLYTFNEYIDKNYNVIEFGSGGGYLLKEIECKTKLGIEINDIARKSAFEIGISSAKTASDIGDEWADLIISTSALEHTHEPLNELKALYKKLKPNGKIVFLVPCESIRYKYKPNDINNHLYSWSPMCIGNLFTTAGFKVIESKAYIGKWPPFYMYIQKYFGWKIFNILCKIYGHIETSWYQVKVVATK